MTNVLDISLNTAEANITTPQKRTFQAWKTDRVNFADYSGVDPTGASDNSAIFATALSDSRSLGLPLYFPAGNWGYAYPTVVQQGDIIFGDGPGTQFTYNGTISSAAVNTLFTTATGILHPAVPLPSDTPTKLSRFRVTGPWNGTTVVYGGDIGASGNMINLTLLDSVIVEDLIVENCLFEAITAPFCTKVRFSNNIVQYCCRDGINFSGSQFVRVLGNIIRYCDDNGISGHSNNSLIQDWGIVQDVVIDGNQLEDSYGISCTGSKRIVISNNTITRTKLQGIKVAYVGPQGSATEGYASALEVSVRGNTITDVIDMQNVNTTSELSYISLGSIAPQGGTASGIPRTNLITYYLSWGPGITVATGVTTVDSNGKLQVVTTSGITGAAAPAWNVSSGGTTGDNTATWTNNGIGIVTTTIPATQTWLTKTQYAYGSLIVDSNGNIQSNTYPPNWAKSTVYGSGALTIDSNSNLQQAENSGTSSGKAPTWATGVGLTTVDNTITWICQDTLPVVPTAGGIAPTWATGVGQLTSGANVDGAINWTNIGPNNVSGTVLPPYGYLNTMVMSGTSATTTLAPGMFIEVANNICVRTLDYTSNTMYSSSVPTSPSGMFTRVSWYNFPLGNQELANGVGVDFFSYGNIPNNLFDVKVHDNIFHGMKYGVFFTTDCGITGLDIFNNKFIDFQQYGIQLPQSTLGPQTIRGHIWDNVFDADPYFRYRFGAPSGTWYAGTYSAFPIAINAENCPGIIYEGNIHRNMYRLTGSTGSGFTSRSNIVYGTYVSTGYNSGNIGVGQLLPAASGFYVVGETANPIAGSFFGQITGVVNPPLSPFTWTPVSGTAYQWYGTQTADLVVTVTSIATSAQSAQAALQIGPDASHWATVDTFTLPSGTATSGSVMTLKTRLPPSWYWELTSGSFANVTANSAIAIVTDSL